MEMPLAVPPPPETLESRDELRRTVGVRLEDDVLLFLGRFNATKGIEFLIQAASVARRVCPGLLLVIVGRDDGALASILRCIERQGAKEWFG